MKHFGLPALMIGAALLIDDRNPLAMDIFHAHGARKLPPNPLDEATRERIAQETIAKSAERQARRMARKQADRERNSHGR